MGSGRPCMNLTIYGKPQPKERPRVYKGHGITPTRTRNYEAKIAAEWRAKYPKPLEGDVRVWITFYMPTPISWSKTKKERAERGIIRPSVRPDIDNLVKIILDGLNGVAFMDDKQVVELTTAKYYSAEPRTAILVEEI